VSPRRPAPQAAPRERGCRRCRRLEAEVETLSKKNRALQAHNRRLERRLQTAKRANKRQAAPFSKGSPRSKPLKPGRRAGADYGVRARRSVPEHIDETVDVPLPLACPDCGGGVEPGHLADQYQTEIPPIRPHVTHFRIQRGVCRACGRAVRGRHPRQTSDAVGAASSQLGPQAVALAAHLNKGLGLSLDKCKALYETAFGIHVSRGGLCHALHRLARTAEPTYEGLIEAVRASPVVSPDETGWKVGGLLQWLWVFATPSLSVYAIHERRGYEQAAAVLGTDFDGTLIRDGWAPYRRFEDAQHQSCLAHLLRRCHQMIEESERGAARFPHDVRRILLQALDLRDRYLRGEVSQHGLAVARGRLEARMDRRLQARRITHPPNRRLLKHLRTEQSALFTFLRDPLNVEATNWWAEQSIRPAVVTRKVSGGNRTWVGAATQQVLASILTTCRKQDRDPYVVLRQSYCSPQPLIISLDPASQPQPP
jgi:transposase